MPIEKISRVQEIIESRKLESIIGTRILLIKNAMSIQQNPAQSYALRKELGDLLAYNDQFYLNPSTDAMMYEDVNRTSKKLEGSTIAIVREEGVGKYIPFIKTEGLYPIALNMTEEHRELSAISKDHSKMHEFVLKHVSNPDIYEDCLAINPHADHAIEKSYSMIVAIKTEKINKKYGFVSPNDKGKEELDREAIGSYISENIEKVDDTIKNETYINIAHAWYAEKKKQ